MDCLSADVCEGNIFKNYYKTYKEIQKLTKTLKSTGVEDLCTDRFVSFSTPLQLPSRNLLQSHFVIVQTSQ